jgi:indole-3-glycerol phosphate synthase
MTFLQTIVEEKRTLVKEKKENTSIEKLLARAKQQKKRSFHDVFKRGNQKDVKIIAEIKRESPSQGMLSHTIKVQELAQKYEEGGASAISVITEAKHFSGSLGFIPLVKNVSYLPILRKDFIVDSWELYETKAYGADAVLLIGEVLKQDELVKFLSIAHTIDLDVLLEVHRMETFKKISGLNGFLLGINTRNLDTLSVDLRTAETMLDKIPNELPVIIESGIENAEDIAVFVERGASGFLIGSSLVLSQDPVKKLRELRGYL